VPEPFEPDRRDGKWTGRRRQGLEEGGALDQALAKIFAVHLHNRWDRTLPKGGWVDRLLLKRHAEEIVERRVRVDGQL
jgi:hypothetical protein